MDVPQVGMIGMRGHSWPRDVFYAFTIIVVAVLSSLATAWLNAPYFDVVNSFVRATGEVPRALFFSSWLVLVGGMVVIWNPPAFGFRLGDTAAHWRLVAGTLAVAAALTWAVLTLFGTTPYGDRSLFVEAVLVPVTEELVFRGVLLTGLLWAFGTAFRSGRVAPLAIVVNGLAFGIAHLANATSLDLGFVLPQVAFAVVLGTGCAWLMFRTRSLYPAILLHAVVNAVVVISF